MQPVLADNLVLVLPRGLSLRDWNRVGHLDREWAYYQKLAAQFGRTILVSSGGPDDQALGQKLASTLPNPSSLTLLWNDTRVLEPLFHASIPARVAQLLAPQSSVLILTEQFTAGAAAVATHAHLKALQHRVALVARGGYLWSRFAARECGPDSPQAVLAGQIEAALCCSADMVMGTTPEMVSDLCWRYHIDPREARCVPNFAIVPEVMTPASERERGLIVTAGNVLARKRIHILIEAIALMDPELKAATTLEVIGQGPELPKLRKTAESLGVSVRFVPTLPHAEFLERLSHASIYAQASDHEGHPRGVLDALAMGAVVVASDAPGLHGMVKTGSTGILVPTAEPRDFANAFAGILTDPDWCDLLGGTAARTIHAEYGIDRVVSLAIEACRDAMRSVKPARSPAA
jgi:glycosyltransferase involved in cell wall biosynthesis